MQPPNKQIHKPMQDKLLILQRPLRKRIRQHLAVHAMLVPVAREDGRRGLDGVVVARVLDQLAIRLARLLAVDCAPALGVDEG